MGPLVASEIRIRTVCSLLGGDGGLAVEATVRDVNRQMQAQGVLHSVTELFDRSKAALGR